MLLAELLMLPGMQSVLPDARFMLPRIQSLFPDLRLMLLGFRLFVPGEQSVLPIMTSMLPAQLAVDAYRESSGSTMPTA